ncbi:MAG: hypothetical protein WBL85_06560 [Sedimentisphaerales bacterium]
MKTQMLAMFLTIVFSSAVTRASSVSVPLPGAVGTLPKTVSFDAGTSFKHIDEVLLWCSGSVTYGWGYIEYNPYDIEYQTIPADIYVSTNPAGFWVGGFCSSEGPFSQEEIFHGTQSSTWDFLLNGQAGLTIQVPCPPLPVWEHVLIPPSGYISQATLIIDGTVIDILSPSLGEILTGGSEYTISWQDYRSQSPCPYSYFLDYSIDGGQHWLAIDPNAVTGSCSYDWIVPHVSSRQCMIRITDANDPNFTDTTVGYFIIHGGLTDLNRDAFVDFFDYAILALNWQQSPDPCDPNSGDINKDSIVDIYDLAELCADWLVCYVTQATDPEPSDLTGDVNINVILQWSPGNNATSQNIYFGTDFNAVSNADTDNPAVYMGNQDANFWDTNNYAPDGLIPDTSYYWRIDEVAGCTAKGDVWSFTTSP